MITVVTPAFNRAHLLPRLFCSLCAQTFSRFEWIVVDDGSTDDTLSLVREFASRAPFPLMVSTRSNGGKHRALNQGVALASGELTMIVDSDDFLPPDALDKVWSQWLDVRTDPSFAGVVGLKAYPDGTVVGSSPALLPSPLDTDLITYRLRYGVEGDRAEVFRTDLLRRFPFPEFPAEKFCPEALVWNRIARHFRMRCFSQITYFCQYLPDGLSASIVRLRCESPRASCLYYSELFHTPAPFVHHVRAGINYWRFAFCRSDGFFHWLDGISRSALLYMIPGFLMHINDKRRR